MHTLNTVILAAGADFWTTPLGTALAAIMKAVALLVVIGAVIKAVQQVMDGKVGKAVQIVLGSLVVVAFLWEPSLIGSLIDTVSGLVGKSVDSVKQVTR